jgi:hypothetical protein
MLHIALDLITAQNIQDLVDTKAVESASIDFKRTFSTKDEPDALRDFCVDVAGFANAGGGDIVFGVKDAKGVAAAAEGVNLSEIERAEQRMRSLLERGIRPAVSGLRWRTVTLDGERGYHVLRVPKSWHGPHLVCEGNTFCAPRRGGTGNQFMDIDELRREFDASRRLLDEIRGWREERLTALAPSAPNMAHGLTVGARLVLHVIPLGSAAQPNRFTASQLFEREARNQTLLGEGATRINMHGVEVRVNDRALTQTFRSGRIEAVAVLNGKRPRGDQAIPIQDLEQRLVCAIDGYLRNLDGLGVTDPVLVFVSLLGIKGWTLTWRGDELSEPQRADADTCHLPAVTYDSPSAKHPRELRSAFDVAWNLAGVHASRSFDEHGGWKGLRLDDQAAERFAAAEGAVP